MRARRTTTVVATVAALAVGHVLTSRIDIGSEPRPFYEYGDLGDQVALSYADVAVTAAQPAHWLSDQDSDGLAIQAGGVWVVVTVEVTPTRAPVQTQQSWLVDDQDRVYRSSSRAPCRSSFLAQTRVPTYTVTCFDVPTDRLAGLRVRVARGDLTDDEVDGDDVADIDLGLSGDDEREWAENRESLRVPFLPDIAPVELQQLTVDEDAAAEEDS